MKWQTRCHYTRPTWSNSQLWVQIGIQGFAQNFWQEKYTKIFVLGFHGILKTTRRFSHHVIWYSRGSSRGMTVLADQNTNTTRVMSMVITLWVPLTKYHIPSPSSWMVVTSCDYSHTDMGFISLAVTSCNYSCANMDFVAFNSQRKVGVDKYTIICKKSPAKQQMIRNSGLLSIFSCISGIKEKGAVMIISQHSSSIANSIIQQYPWSSSDVMASSISIYSLRSVQGKQY